MIRIDGKTIHKDIKRIDLYKYFPSNFGRTLKLAFICFGYNRFDILNYIGVLESLFQT